MILSLPSNKKQIGWIVTLHDFHDKEQSKSKIVVLIFRHSFYCTSLKREAIFIEENFLKKQENDMAINFGDFI